MATAVGASASVSTWGKFRCAYGRNTSALTISEHNAEYENGFKSASEGSGLIRIKAASTRSAFYYQPTFKNFWTDVPDNENQITIFGGSDTSPSFPATAEVEAQLTGETMTLDNGGVTIASSLFSASAIQIEPGPPDLGSVLTIGKLTAF